MEEKAILWLVEYFCYSQVSANFTSRAGAVSPRSLLCNPSGLSPAAVLAGPTAGISGIAVSPGWREQGSRAPSTAVWGEGKNNQDGICPHGKATGYGEVRALFFFLFFSFLFFLVFSFPLWLPEPFTSNPVC